MRKLTAYFADRKSATAAAFFLSETLEETDDIILSEQCSEDINIFDFCLKATFVGGFFGVATGLLLQGILKGSIFPLSAFICGLVIGAIAGCIIDFVSFSELPFSPTLTVSANKESIGFILKLLKQRGSIVSFLHK